MKETIYIEILTKHLRTNRWDIIATAFIDLDKIVKKDFGVKLDFASVADEFERIGVEIIKGEKVLGNRVPDITFTTVKIPKGCQYIRFYANQQGKITSAFVKETK
jgi:hypothetical protein